jgi:hypothetical protein
VLDRTGQIAGRDPAQDAWRQAAAILLDLHHPDAPLILAKLSKLPHP